MVNGSLVQTKDWLGALELSPAWEEAVQTNLLRMVGDQEPCVAAYGYKQVVDDSRLHRQGKWELIILTPMHLVKMIVDNNSCKTAKIALKDIKAICVTTKHYIGPSQHQVGERFLWEELQDIRILFSEEVSKPGLMDTQVQIPDPADTRPEEAKEPFIKGVLEALIEAGIQPG